MRRENSMHFSLGRADAKREAVPGQCGSVVEQPMNQEVTGSIPGHSTCPGFRHDRCLALTFVFLSPSFLPRSKKRKVNMSTVTLLLNNILISLDVAMLFL